MAEWRSQLTRYYIIKLFHFAHTCHFEFILLQIREQTSRTVQAKLDNPFEGKSRKRSETGESPLLARPECVTYIKAKFKPEVKSTMIWNKYKVLVLTLYFMLPSPPGKKKTHKCVSLKAESVICAP